MGPIISPHKRLRSPETRQSKAADHSSHQRGQDHKRQKVSPSRHASPQDAHTSPEPVHGTSLGHQKHGSRDEPSSDANQDPAADCKQTLGRERSKLRPASDVRPSREVGDEIRQLSRDCKRISPERRQPAHPTGSRKPRHDDTKTHTDAGVSCSNQESRHSKAEQRRRYSPAVSKEPPTGRSHGRESRQDHAEQRSRESQSPGAARLDQAAGSPKRHSRGSHAERSCRRSCSPKPARTARSARSPKRDSRRRGAEQSFKRAHSPEPVKPADPARSPKRNRRPSHAEQSSKRNRSPDSTKPATSARSPKRECRRSHAAQSSKQGHCTAAAKPAHSARSPEGATKRSKADGISGRSHSPDAAKLANPVTSPHRDSRSNHAGPGSDPGSPPCHRKPSCPHDRAARAGGMAGAQGQDDGRSKARNASALPVEQPETRRPAEKLLNSQDDGRSKAQNASALPVEQPETRRPAEKLLNSQDDGRSKARNASALPVEQPETRRPAEKLLRSCSQDAEPSRRRGDPEAPSPLQPAESELGQKNAAGPLARISMDGQESVPGGGSADALSSDLNPALAPQTQDHGPQAHGGNKDQAAGQSTRDRDIPPVPNLEAWAAEPSSSWLASSDGPADLMMPSVDDGHRGDRLLQHPESLSERGAQPEQPQSAALQGPHAERWLESAPLDPPTSSSLAGTEDLAAVLQAGRNEASLQPSDTAADVGGVAHVLAAASELTTIDGKSQSAASKPDVCSGQIHAPPGSDTESSAQVASERGAASVGAVVRDVLPAEPLPAPPESTAAGSAPDAGTSPPNGMPSPMGNSRSDTHMQSQQSDPSSEAIDADAHAGGKESAQPENADRQLQKGVHVACNAGSSESSEQQQGADAEPVMSPARPAKRQKVPSDASGTAKSIHLEYAGVAAIQV